MSSSNAVYMGSKRRLVIAFDLGTTFSGVSYRFAFLMILYAPALTVPAVFWIPARRLRFAE